MFATLIQERLDARAEFQQGEEQSRLRERLRTDYCVADFLNCEMDSGEIDKVVEKVLLETKRWLIRRVSEVKENPRKQYRLALDIAESLEYVMTKKDLENYHKALIERAIDNQYEITKE